MFVNISFFLSHLKKNCPKKLSKEIKIIAKNYQKLLKKIEKLLIIILLKGILWCPLTHLIYIYIYINSFTKDIN